MAKPIPSVEATNTLKDTSDELQKLLKKAEAQAKSKTALSKEAAAAFDEQLKTAQKAFNKASATYAQEGGSLTGSIRALGYRMGDKLGIGATKLSAAEKVKAATDAHLDKSAGRIERYISKPFRVAAKYPGVAIGAAVVGAGVLVSSFLSGRAEKRTQENAQAQLAEAAMRPANPYTITPEDYAAMQAKMRGNGHAPMSQVEALAARQQQQTAAPTAAL